MNDGPQGDSGLERVNQIGDIDAEVLATISPAVARRYRVLPLAILKGKRFRVAMSEPLQMETLDTLRYLLQSDVEPVLAPKEEIERAIKKYYVAEKIDTTTYWPRDSKVEDDGTIVMHTSGTNENGLWTGQLTVTPDEADYEFWRWVAAHSRKWRTFEKEQVDQIKEEFRRST